MCVPPPRPQEQKNKPGLDRVKVLTEQNISCSGPKDKNHCNNSTQEDLHSRMRDKLDEGNREGVVRRDSCAQGGAEPAQWLGAWPRRKSYNLNWLHGAYLTGYSTTSLHVPGISTTF